MKLQITKSQRDVKGFLGGHKGVRFNVSVIAELSAEDRELIDRYFPKDTVLYRWEYFEPGSGEPQHRHIYVNTLVGGQTFECSGLGDIIDLENGIVAGANRLHGHLEVAKTFGGTIEIDIPRQDD